MDYKILNFIYIPFLALTNYLSLSIEYLAILISLIVIDFFVGAIKAYARYEFCFRSLWLGFIIKLLFILIPFVFALAVKVLGYHFVFLLEFVVHGLILSEVFSILRNIYIIKTNKNIPDFDFLSLLLSKLRQIIESVLK